MPGPKRGIIIKERWINGLHFGSRETVVLSHERSAWREARRDMASMARRRFSFPRTRRAYRLLNTAGFAGRTEVE